MKNRIERILGLFIFVVMISLALTGCTVKDSASINNNMIENEKETYYEKSVLNLNLSQDFDLVPGYFKVMYEYLYFVRDGLTGEEEEHFSSRYIDRIRICEDADAEPVFEVTDEYLLAYKPFNDNGEEVVYVLSFDEENCLLRMINSAGNISDCIVISDKNVCKYYPTDVIAVEEDCFVLLSNEYIYVIDGEGTCLRTVSCPGKSFQEAVELWEGRVAVTYYREDGEFYLSYFDVVTGKLAGEIPIPSPSLIAGNEEILFSAGSIIYRLDTATNQACSVVNLADYNLVSSWNKAIYANETGFSIVSYNESSAKKSVQMITLSETEGKILTESENGKYDAEGKRIVTLYATVPEMRSDIISDDMITEFNLENKDYSVVVCDSNKTLDDMFIQKEQPDILFEMIPDRIEDYVRNGYIEDLWPYIDQSEKLDRDDLAEGIKGCFEFDGKMYAIPRYVSVRSLLGRKSQVPEKGYWNVDEFLAWLESHPEAYSYWGLTGENILEYCMLGNMEEYVNLETGKASFEQSNFRELLIRINEIDMKNSNVNIYPVVPPPESVSYEPMVYLYDAYLTYLFTISEMDFCFGENMVDMGFPNNEGEKKSVITSYANLAIFSNSECKEGAYEFIEYCLLYETDRKQSIKGNNAPGGLWTVQSVRDSDINSALGEHVIYLNVNDEQAKVSYTVTEEDKELFLGIFENATADSKEMREIRKIVQEEVQSLFAGQTNVDDTCKKIQSRVQLFLDESR